MGEQLKPELHPLLRRLAPFAELLGILLFLAPAIGTPASGMGIYDFYFELAFGYVGASLLLRPLATPLLIAGLLLVAALLRWRARLASADPRVALLARVATGYLFMHFLAFLQLDLIFFRGAFVAAPFLLGILLLAATLLAHLGDSELRTAWRGFPRNPGASLRSLGRGGKFRALRFGLVLLVALYLVLPNMLPLSGLLPSPLERPAEGYGSDARPFGVEVVAIAYEPEGLLAGRVLPDGEIWQLYIYVPQTESAQTLPVGIYLHGFGATDPETYAGGMRTLASRGMLAVFVQYGSSFRPGDEAVADITYGDGVTNDPLMGLSSEMAWQAALEIEALLAAPPPALATALGASRASFEHLFIGGHSWGGGVALYVASKAAGAGWGSRSMALALDAPAVTSGDGPYAPDFDNIPAHAIISIAGYEFDHRTSACIGMWHYEQLRERYPGGSPNASRAAFLLIRGDDHGFPRQVTSHYLVTDPLRPGLALANFAFHKRIDAMAGYLVASANGDNTTASSALPHIAGGGAEMTWMGEWSDGTPIRPALYSRDPFGLRGGNRLVDDVIPVSWFDCDVPPEAQTA